MEPIIVLAAIVFLVWGAVAFLAMVWRWITGAGSQEQQANPWDNVNAIVAMPVQRPDGSYERARIVWESDPGPGAQQPRAGGRKP